jgi:hypothetical protein
MSDAKKHTGSCHCGAVRFEVEVDATRGSRCNCSICSRLAATTAIVKPAAFSLLAGEEALTAYEWGGRTARRFFCSRCGITCFARGYLEQVGGEYVSVMLNCLDGVDPAAISVQYWDGRHNNWAAGPRDTPWPIEAAAPA